MTAEEFKKDVIETVDFILSTFGGDMLFMIIKPIITLAKPELRKMLDQNPEDVYNWLKEAQKKLNKTIKAYDNKM
jgi:hypothetical protein